MWPDSSLGSLKSKISNKYRKHWKSYVSFQLSGQTGSFWAVLKKKSIKVCYFWGFFSCFHGQIVSNIVLHFSICIKKLFNIKVRFFLSIIWIIDLNRLNIYNQLWERITSMLTVLDTNLWFEVNVCGISVEFTPRLTLWRQEQEKEGLRESQRLIMCFARILCAAISLAWISASGL